ncbi:CENP-Q, a CENPA-CAD centromere complex subunit-domain-containing protein [Aspergillus pseudodeflectus]|uniref:CENP-Q, a CENPA-CAD centromere complex subunit-domain-containing protein n=1 Tax=Aspergillus pseudodeflectus TaxID=176178 RepID=A0ABR4K2K4_9EURO
MPPKRKRTDDAPDINTNDRRTKPYPYLKPQVRHISERTIKAKWSTLPEPAQDKIRDMFRALERPVIVRQQNDRKRYEAQAAVQAVVKNLGKRLPRMPFPPLTKDSVFEYEAALKEHSALESTLSTMTDSIDLLKHEIAKEEALLAKEMKKLQELERDAKRVEAEGKRQMKNEHPLLRQLEKPDQDTGGRTEFTVSTAKDSCLGFDELEDDPEVSSLLKQLNNHLRSMQSNVAPLAGLQDAITRSQTALSLASMPND